MKTTQKKEKIPLRNESILNKMYLGLKLTHISELTNAKQKVGEKWLAARKNENGSGGVLFVRWSARSEF